VSNEKEAVPAPSAKEVDPKPKDRQGSLNTVSNSFMWYALTANAELERLRRELKTKDPPEFKDRLADGIFNLAIELGAAMTGQYLALKVAKHVLGGAAAAAADGGHAPELLKDAFKYGTAKGLEAGHHALHGHTDDDGVDRFIDAQLKSHREAGKENQDHFDQVIRPLVTSDLDATAMANACSNASLEVAAKQQYNISRDAWVSYLAQSKYGAVSHKDGHSTTNMSGHADRKKANAGPSEHVPADAPDFEDAIWGRTPGVLTVVAEVPGFDGAKVIGRPRVRIAYLNGVESKIRSQYQNQVLADSKIPRHIVAKVDMVDRAMGAQPFTVSADESGKAMGLDAGGSAWLTKNYEAHNPGSHPSPETKIQAGLFELLNQLYVSDIKKPII
jgi:hypothetical protein